MIVSTLPTYPGKKVVKDLGLVYAYDDAIRGMRIMAEVDTYIRFCQKRLKENALQAGANAVLGVSIAIGDNAKVVMIGTAVILEDVK